MNIYGSDAEEKLLGIHRQLNNEWLEIGTTFGKKVRFSPAYCIYLAMYVNNDELSELPCSHFFQQDCVDKWLKINNSCPLLKAGVGETLLSSLTEATA
ncbi:hypothetical protein H5410_039240 [Solanum commersonii]|uniref:RING-type domain-containing protein n=1 Tax=Solanum commersonii TaxID=4109 RepID=A0A9J5YEG5_SOLCO|nr:hypothetical protein H5410_039240 [Solanum commersonii]